VNTTSNVLSVVLALICLASAGADFARLPRIVQSLEHLNVPTRIMPVLGAIKVVGALGLFIGLGADGLANLAPAAVLLVLSAITFLTSL
jgi:hypothetical protein